MLECGGSGGMKDRASDAVSMLGNGHLRPGWRNNSSLKTRQVKKDFHTFAWYVCMDGWSKDVYV